MDLVRGMRVDIATVISSISRPAGRIVEDEGLKKQAARIAKHCLE